MATALTIATVDKLSLMQPDWEIVEALNGRNTFTFRILSLDGSYRPAGGAVVEFEHGSVEFNGTIHSVSEEGLGGLGVTPIVSTVHCVDYNELPDRRQVEVTIPGGSTLKQALQQLVEYLSDYGVTLWASQVNGPTFSEDVVFQMGTLTGCFDKLALMSSALGTSYVWNIGYDKVLSMFAVGTDTAPTVADSDGFVLDDIKVTPVDMSAYANVVRVRFTTAAQVAYVYLQAAVNFTALDTVTIASKAYTFKAAITGGDNVDGNVKIGASLEASLQNLRAAINLDAGSGSTYAALMTVNPDVKALDQSSTLMKAQALVAGAAGNTIACSEGSTDAGTFWTIGGTSSVSTLKFGEDESLSGSVTATTSPAAADVRERTYDHPEVLNEDTAQALADGYLTRDSVLPKTTWYRTDDSAAGTHPGQTQTFVQPKRNLSSAHLITEVRITPQDAMVWYDITMVSTSTVAPAHPLEMYRHWGRGGGGSAGGAVHAGVGGGGGGGGGISGGSGRLIDIQTFTSGSGTYTPATGVNLVEIELVGGGGGGAGVASAAAGQVNLGGGGGGGAYLRKQLTTGFSGAAYSVGAGGAKGASGDNNGSDGASTTFTVGGTVYTAGGGGLASQSTSLAAPMMAVSGTGGTATNGDLNISGHSGSFGHASNATIGYSGGGGGSFLGAGGRQLQLINGASSAGNAGLGYGGGGAGAVSSNSGGAKAGGDGAAGIIIVRGYA